MRRSARRSAFENVRNQVGCCGIWCGSCVVGNGALRKLTSEYRKMLEAYDVLKWGAKDCDPEAFLEGLESIARVPVCAGCLKGGGRENCELRACASSKGIPDCTECDAPENCEHKDLLQHMRSGALDAGLFVKTRRGSSRPLIAKWTADLKERFPCCILFMPEDSCRT